MGRRSKAARRGIAPILGGLLAVWGCQQPAPPGPEAAPEPVPLAPVEEGGPVLDHFLCYEGLPVDHGMQFLVQDQFDDGFKRFNSLVLRYFCNPVDKTRDGKETPKAHPDHHLAAYFGGHDAEVPRAWKVSATNQFAPAGTELTLRNAEWSLVPTDKDAPEDHPEPEGLDHFQCYPVVEGPAAAAVVDLDDELEGEYQGLEVGRAEAFCNPVAKEGAPKPAAIQHPDEHLVCYRVEASAPELFLGTNQLGAVKLAVRGPVWLCAPSTKGDWRELPPEEVPPKPPAAPGEAPEAGSRGSEEGS